MHQGHHERLRQAVAQKYLADHDGDVSRHCSVNGSEGT